MKHLALIVMLVLSALVLSFKIYDVWNHDQVAKSPAPPRTAAVAQEKQFDRRTPAPVATYEPIVERNLFNPERKEFIPPPPVVVPPPPVVTAPEIKEVRVAGQEIVLYGTLSRGNFQSALINNPLKSATDKRESRWVKVGDSIANLQVEAILHDKLIVREENNRYIILMRDPAKPKAAASPGIYAAGTNRGAPAVVPTDAAPVTAKAADKAGGEPAQTTKEDKQEGDEYEIVKTPFGNQRVRKNKSRS